ncbi:hypothetical protein LWI29_005762 [Acer saccharum]|uniref:Uncharacterized protein n=1 Tax=Acer saccharum TaxID=4024 RepID=A0AA39VFH2_ACESA|nr:hypothetical protein LWI29_005762 [Acer saccharum]
MVPAVRKKGYYCSTSLTSGSPTGFTALTIRFYCSDHRSTVPATGVTVPVVRLTVPTTGVTVPATGFIIWELWRDGKAPEIVDSCINDSCPANEVMRCIQVGLLCVQDNAKDRPSMSNVVFMLSNGTVLPSPKKSSFPVRNSDLDSSIGTKRSNNEVTNTTFDGR